MLSTTRNLIIACSIALVGQSLTGSALGQIDHGQQASKNSANTQANESEIIDHSSMSPDSWSAPASVGPPVASVATNTMLPSTAPAGKSEVQFQPFSNKPFTAPRFQQANATPSIPDLNANSIRQPTNQIKSLLRQPNNNAGQSPFQQARYKLGGQAGLPQTNVNRKCSEQHRAPNVWQSTGVAAKDYR